MTYTVEISFRPYSTEVDASNTDEAIALAVARLEAHDVLMGANFDVRLEMDES